MKSVFVSCLLLCLVATVWAQSNPVPLIGQPLIPTSAAPGGAGFSLRVIGTGFVSTSTVNWNGRARTTTFVNGTELSAAISSTDIAAAGSATVTVVNPAPGGGTSRPAVFEIGLPTASTGLFSRTDFSSKNLTAAAFSEDFNGDGVMDLAILGQIHGLRILLGNGDGSFRSGPVYATGVPATAITGGDFNRDGNLDLAVSSTHCKFVPCPEGQIDIRLGNGDGTFRDPVKYLTGQQPQQIAAVDLNGDGALDLVTGNNCSSNCDGPVNALSVLLGVGDGTFLTHTDMQLADSFYVYAMAVGDVNGDGKADLVTANYCFFECAMSVLLGNGDGTFHQGMDVPTAGVADLTLTDVNGDGLLDLAATEGRNLDIFLGNGDGTFQDEVKVSAPSFAEAISAGDFNDDGKVDLVVTSSENSGMVSIFRGNGDGTFQPHLDYPTGAITTAHSLIVGDLNRDGRADLVTANFNDGTASVLLQSTLSASRLALEFSGPVLVGSTTAPQPVSITNIGVQTLHFSSIGVTGTNSADFAQQNNCGSSLAPGASCSIKVTFSPTDIRRRSAGLTFTDDSAVGQQTIPLRGIATVVSLSASSLEFGDQAVGTTSNGKTVTVVNHGARKIRMYVPSILGTNARDFAQSNTCGETLAAGASCAITVRFKPHAKGTRVASLSVSDTGGDSPQTVTLTGTGT
jgi:hypothetical protein